MKGRVRCFGRGKTVVRHVAPDAAVAQYRRTKGLLMVKIVAMDESGAYSDWNDKASLRQLFSKSRTGRLLSNPRFCQ
jgi:hypothetical protein